MRKIVLMAAAVAMTAMAACTGNSTEVREEATPADSAQALANVETPANGVIEVTTDTIDAPKGMVVVMDFNATWCGPCKEYGPTFHEVARRYEGKAAFYSVDVDVNKKLREKYVGQFIPQTTAIAADGQVFSHTGQLSEKDLMAFVDSVLAIPAN